MAAAPSTARSRPTAGTRCSWPVVLVVILGVLGDAIGYALIGTPAGGVFAAIVHRRRDRRPDLVGSYFGGDKLVLAASRRKPVDEDQRAPAHQRVRELPIAANLPMPKVYIIDDTRPERLRDRPRPEARLDRDHDRPAREARPRGAPGRPRPRALARPQLRHPVLAARRGPRRQRSPSWPTSSCASRSGAAAGGRNDRDSGGGTALQLIIFVVAIVLAILAPIFTRLVQLAVSRQREYLADASSVELTRNPLRARARPGQDRPADQEVLEVANRAHPAPVLHQPDQEARGALVGPHLDPPADPRPDQPPAPADRRAAARRHRTRPAWPVSSRVGERRGVRPAPRPLP